MDIKTKFNLQEKVHINEVQLNGVVMAFFINCENTIQYSIRYFKDNIAQTAYFYDFEIEPYKEIKKEVGFSQSK